uniref:Serpentine Receptor, class H n=1 Tax=Caenorhabditis tropicalis TaxID=1561998 RepID=A0A1I7UBD7_9PELO
MTIFYTDYVESTCRQNHTYFASSDFLLTAYHFTALFTIPLSLFTFLTIIRVTPRKMKNLKVPMLIAHVWSTNLDLMLTVYSAPLMFFPSAAGLPMGLFGLAGIAPKWLAYIGQVSVIMMGVNFVMLLENRHSQIDTINAKMSRRRTRIIYFVVNYIMAFLFILPFYLENTDQYEIRKFVLKRIPCPIIDFYDEKAYILLRGGELLPFISISTGLFVIVSQTIYFASNTIYHLNYVRNANLSDSTKALQKKFLSYVVMQVTIPWIVLCSPIIYSLVADRYDYYNQTLNNVSMILMASHGLLSTSCTLFIIKPYREFVKNIIRGNTSFNPADMWATQAKDGSVAVGSDAL